MPEMSPGAALRQLRQAHAGLKKARQLIRMARENPESAPKVLKAGWESLARAHQTLASIPVEAANDAVMTQQLSVQRYATALLVRLRRISRREFTDEDTLDLDEAGDELE
jgi:hypothetical protein